MAQHRILILGGGMIGSAVALDLSRRKDFAVTVADIDPEALARIASQIPVHTVRTDVSQSGALKSISREHDLLIGALPSAIGYETLRTALEAGRHIVDISFMPENPLDLHDLARRSRVTALVDCGVAPGLSNIMAGFAASELSPCERIDIFVGGLPVEREWPYEYKAGFSPLDVIEEYVRPARIVERGRVTTKEALSDRERLSIPGVGELEAFLTDGLRTLTHTLDVPFMKEKTLRYPGHAALMQVLRETGFFSKELVRAGNQQVRPLDLTTALLFPRWRFREGESDLTILRVVAAGRRGGDPVEYVWDLLDRSDTSLRSIARTTAFSAAIVAGLVAEGRFEPGVHAPETIGRNRLLPRVLGELAARGVRCDFTVTRPGEPRA